MSKNTQPSFQTKTCTLFWSYHNIIHIWVKYHLHIIIGCIQVSLLIAWYICFACWRWGRGDQHNVHAFNGNSFLRLLLFFIGRTLNLHNVCASVRRARAASISNIHCARTRFVHLPNNEAEKWFSIKCHSREAQQHTVYCSQNIIRTYSTTYKFVQFCTTKKCNNAVLILNAHTQTLISTGLCWLKRSTDTDTHWNTHPQN